MAYKLKSPPSAGIEYDFGGGVTLLVPPLSLGALETLQGGLAALKSAASATDPAAVRTVVDAAHAALRRNYPDITREDVGELIDLSNMLDVIAMVMDVSGVRRKEVEAAKNQQAQTAGQQGTPSPQTGPD